MASDHEKSKGVVGTEIKGHLLDYISGAQSAPQPPGPPPPSPPGPPPGSPTPDGPAIPGPTEIPPTNPGGPHLRASFPF